MKLSNLWTFARAIPSRAGVKDQESKRVLDALAEGFKHITEYLKTTAESKDRPKGTPAALVASQGSIPFLIAGEGITLRKLPNGAYEISMASSTMLRLLKSSGAGGGSLGGQESIELVSRNFHLVNDQDAPGASKYYGTDADGNKGFHSSATIPNGIVDGQILVWSNANGWTPTTPTQVPVITGISYSTSTHKLTYEYGTIGVVSWSPSSTIGEVFEAEECSDTPGQETIQATLPDGTSVPVTVLTPPE